jgi:uncharacterized RDD family membrane protein YckC
VDIENVDTQVETVVQSFQKDPHLQDHWIKRLVAYIIDSIILYVVTGVLLMVVLFPFNIGNLLSVFNVLSFPFASGLLSVIYFTILESTNGASFGKGLMNLKVITKEKENLTIEKAFIRNISKVHPVLLLLDLVCGLITSTDLHQKYSDKIANTTVE